MERSRRIFPLAGLLFVIGGVGLSHFSQHVRGVEAVGLSGAGFAFGVGVTLIILVLRGRIKL